MNYVRKRGYSMDILKFLGIGETISALGIVTIIGVVSGILTVLTSIFDFPKKKITFKVFLIIFIVCCVIAFVLIGFSNGDENPPIQTDPIPSSSASVESNGPEETEPTEANKESDDPEPSKESDNPEPSAENHGDDLTDIEPDTVALEDVAWLEEEKIYSDDTATTTRGETWSNCIRFGSSNLNADGDSYIVVVCDQKYSKFTAKIAPQKGFDHSDVVTLYIYGVCSDNDELIFREEYQISNSTKSFEVEIDITGVDDLYFYKDGEYGTAKIAGQYLNGYTGMAILMSDAVLHK